MVYEEKGGYSSNSHFIHYFFMVPPQFTSRKRGDINPGLTLLPLKPAFLLDVQNLENRDQPGQMGDSLTNRGTPKSSI